jgi:hypothetical protein
MGFVNAFFHRLGVDPQIGMAVVAIALVYISYMMLRLILTRGWKADSLDASFLEDVHSKLSPDEMKRVRAAFLRQTELERQRKTGPRVTLTDLSQMAQGIPGPISSGAPPVKRVIVQPVHPPQPAPAPQPLTPPVVSPAPPVRSVVEEDFPFDPDFMDSSDPNDFQDPVFRSVEPQSKQPTPKRWGMEPRPDDTVPPPAKDKPASTLVDVDLLYQRGLIGEEEYRKIKQMFRS